MIWPTAMAVPSWPKLGFESATSKLRSPSKVALAISGTSISAPLLPAGW